MAPIQSVTSRHGDTFHVGGTVADHRGRLWPVHAIEPRGGDRYAIVSGRGAVRTVEAWVVVPAQPTTRTFATTAPVADNCDRCDALVVPSPVVPGTPQAWHQVGPDSRVRVLCTPCAHLDAE